MFAFAPMTGRRKPTGAGMILAGLMCAGIAPGPALHAQGAPQQAASIPKLASADFGWLKPPGDEFIAPESGPGPIRADTGHPYVSNAIAAQMEKANDEVLAGKVGFTARSRCWPHGVPGFLLYPVHPIFFIQTPKEVLMTWGQDFQLRHVYLNVPHSPNPKPSWYGESIGHYENGDTLVVDTIGLNDRTYVDNYRTPHTTQLHVVERFKLIDGGEGIEVNVRVEDPGAFTMPWNAIQRYRRDQRSTEVPLR